MHVAFLSFRSGSGLSSLVPRRIVDYILCCFIPFCIVSAGCRRPSLPAPPPFSEVFNRGSITKGDAVPLYTKSFGCFDAGDYDGMEKAIREAVHLDITDSNRWIQLIDARTEDNSIQLYYKTLLDRLTSTSTGTDEKSERDEKLVAVAILGWRLTNNRLHSRDDVFEFRSKAISVYAGIALQAGVLESLPASAQRDVCLDRLRAYMAALRKYDAERFPR